MVNHKPIFFQGSEVSIAHLAPMTLECACVYIGRNLVIGVDFRNHCYTEDFDPALHTREQIILYDSPKRPRVFCPIRHELSFQLPEILAKMMKQKVFQTRQVRNYVFAVTLSITNGFYEIYFMIQRAEHEPASDLRVTVESAYPVDVRSPLPRWATGIKFDALAYKILQRKEVRFGPR